MARLFRLLAALAFLIAAPPLAAQKIGTELDTKGLAFGGLGVDATYVDASHPLPITQGSASLFADGTASTATSTSALASNLVVTSTASKRLASFQVSADTTLSAAAWYVMIFNATSAPADGAVTPVKCIAVPASTTSVAGSFNGNSPTFSTGITIAVSTTGCFTKTASVHAFISGDSF